MLRYGLIALFLTFGAMMSGCKESPPPPRPSGEGGWLQGTTDEKFDTVSKHLRGFDMAMVETGYRYVELYWAGQDENWGYADYQAKKIRLAIENGLERRPKRAASAQAFLTQALPLVEEAIAQKNAEAFRERFTMLTAACNGCHVTEKVEFTHVHLPEQRPSPIRLATE